VRGFDGEEWSIESQTLFLKRNNEGRSKGRQNNLVGGLQIKHFAFSQKRRADRWCSKKSGREKNKKPARRVFWKDAKQEKARSENLEQDVMQRSLGGSRQQIFTRAGQ